MVLYGILVHARRSWYIVEKFNDHRSIPSLIMAATSISGFTVIPISYSTTATHFLYARAHANSSKSKAPAFPDGRTLFLVNVPPDATERQISQFFKHCGTVERVEFDRKDSQDAEEEEDESSDEEMEEEDADLPPQKRRKLAKADKKQAPKVIPLPKNSLRTMRRTGRSCHVVFLDASSLESAVSQPQKLRPWPVDPEAPTGLAHYTALYDALRPPLDIVREHAYTAVSLYQYQRENRKQQSKYHKGEAVVDEDGFTLVTRGGAYGKTLGGEVAVASKKFMAEAGGRTRKRKEKKEKDTFYAFQIHEKNRKSAYSILCGQSSNSPVCRYIGSANEIQTGCGKGCKTTRRTEVQTILGTIKVVPVLFAA